LEPFSATAFLIRPTRSFSNNCPTAVPGLM
jgi:hypothetical protein